MKVENVVIDVKYIGKDRRHEVVIREGDKLIGIESFGKKFWTKKKSFQDFGEFVSQYKPDVNFDRLKIQLEEEWLKQFEKKEGDLVLKKAYDKKTLEEVHEVIRKWLFIPNNEDVEIILAAALDRRVKGEPFWLFIVAPPGNTKTEIIRALPEGNMFYQLSTLTANSFISGYLNPDGTKVEDMAEQINGKVLVIKDFTSILSMNKDKRDEIIGQLRDAYDGYLTRKLGNISKKITHNTSFGLISGVTPALDKYYKVIGQLGERFLRLRFDYADDELLTKVEDNEGKEDQMREEMSDAIMGLLTNLEIYDVNFSEKNILEIKELSKFVAKMRTPITSRWEGSELVMDVKPQSEKPGRIYKQLKKAGVCLSILKNEKELSRTTIKALTRIAKDSCPPDRLMIWDFLNENKPQRESEIINELRIPRSTCKRLLESLWRVGVLDKEILSDGSGLWNINKKFARHPTSFSEQVSQEVDRGESVETLLKGVSQEVDRGESVKGVSHKRGIVWGEFLKLPKPRSGFCFHCNELKVIYWIDQDDKPICHACKNMLTSSQEVE